MCHYTRQDGASLEMIYALHVCYWLNISLAFCFMEVDRIQAKSTVLEAKELQQGYRGEVLSFPGCNMFQHASTSVIPGSDTVEINPHPNRVNLFGSSVLFVYNAS